MAEDSFFSRIGIFGVGLMGGSLGLALKESGSHSKVIGIGRNSEKLREAQHLGAIDEWSTEPGSITPPLDLLVVCTPVRRVPEHVRLARPALAPHTLITDVGSTKANVVRESGKAAPTPGQFIGSHPMAGSHKAGIQAAVPNLYKNRVCVVTVTDQSSPDAVERITRFWQNLGMYVVQMTPEQHDLLTAFSSHLPHLLASTLCHTVMDKNSAIEPVLGKGFRDTTRIAAGDADVWLDICMENRASILESIHCFRQNLQHLEELLAHSDESALFQYLDHARVWKNSLEERKTQIESDE